MSLFDSPAAFAPMFDDHVVVKGTRRNGENVRGTFAACVFPVESDDPLADVDVDTTRRRVFVEIPRTGPGGWNRTDLPQIGDLVVYRGETYAAVSVSVAVGSDNLTIIART